MHPHGEISTALRNGFDVCVMQKCWTYTETSKRQRENKATSLFLCKALQRMPAEFLGLFFKHHTCVHMCVHVVHTQTFLNFGSCFSISSWYQSRCLYLDGLSKVYL